jgi:hypothetical protein
MNPTTLIAGLKVRGVELVVRDGKLRARGAETVLTPDVLGLIAHHRAQLLAVLTGRAVPSSVKDVVWDPRGGVRVTRPADLRALALQLAGALPQPFPRMNFERCDVSVQPGRQAWWAFCGAATKHMLTEVVTVLDDADATEAAEIRAICELF